MDAPCPSPKALEISNNSQQIIKKQLIINNEYKLTIFTISNHLNFKIEKLNNILLYYYQNNYEFKAIIK